MNVSLKKKEAHMLLGLLSSVLPNEKMSTEIQVKLIRALRKKEAKKNS